MLPIYLLFSFQLFSLLHIWEQDFWLHAQVGTGFLSISCSLEYREWENAHFITLHMTTSINSDVHLHKTYHVPLTLFFTSQGWCLLDSQTVIFSTGTGILEEYTASVFWDELLTLSSQVCVMYFKASVWVLLFLMHVLQKLTVFPQFCFNVTQVTHPIFLPVTKMRLFIWPPITSATGWSASLNLRNSSNSSLSSKHWGFYITLPKPPDSNVSYCNFLGQTHTKHELAILTSGSHTLSCTTSSLFSKRDISECSGHSDRIFQHV
jgi:hypothetical protein